jgi:hypothetical protein
VVELKGGGDSLATAEKCRSAPASGENDRNWHSAKSKRDYYESLVKMTK